ncbi:hypothetical protein FA13DRAFT_1735958 [Coprinellus micaceus]|uniref:Uncharacterized protein n=1 Tax=Coprinellus micaceus TaxID=71717 RepID=A0A4Y7T3D2_COPMI|nr:hypothetical protein FA13DRAFT_1735958 [Coprinellus micaceus]
MGYDLMLLAPFCPALQCGPTALSYCQYIRTLRQIYPFEGGSETWLVAHPKTTGT